MKQRPLLLSLLSLLFFFTACNQSEQKILTKEDIAHANVAVITGSVHDVYASTNLPKANLLRLDSEPDIFVALDSKKVDVALADGAIYLIKYASMNKYAILDTLFTEDFGIGFRDTELRDQFNIFLAEIRANGTYDSVFSHWFENFANTRMPQWDDTPTGEPIKVRITGTLEGFSFILDGEPAGFDVDLMVRFGRSIGCPVEVSYMNFGGLIAALSSGAVDVVTSAMTITEERAKQVAFSDPYFNSTSVAVVLKERSGDILEETQLTFDDIATSKVAVVMGNLHDTWMAENYPNTNTLRYEGYPDVLMSLENGNSDIAMVEGILYETSLKQKGIYAHIGVLFDDPYGVGFSLDDTALRDEFNNFLQEIRANGVYEEMRLRWIDNYATAQMPDLPPAPTGKPLRLGCTGTSEVFDFIQNGKNAGFDIEMMERFGRYISRPIEYYSLNFGGLISALAAKKVDAIASAMSITEERAKRVAYSDPYFISESIAIAMKRGMNNTAETNSWRTMDDVKDKRFGVLMSSIQDEYITKTYPKAEVMRIDLAPDLIMAMKSGQCDVVVLASPVAQEVMKTDTELGILDPDIHTVEFGIGFRDEAMRDRFNTYLKEIRASGLYKEMETR